MDTVTTSAQTSRWGGHQGKRILEMRSSWLSPLWLVHHNRRVYNSSNTHRQNENIYKRGRYSAEFKGKVALEALSGAKIHVRIAPKYGISSDLAKDWKKQAKEVLGECFKHGGAERKFTYGYLAGSNLLQSLAMPNKVTLTQTWEEKRDLLAEMLYTRLNDAGKKVEVTRRGYAYDALGRPTSRTQAYPQQSVSRDDSFDYNRRSELTGAKLGEAPYAYAYDNIGNRITAQEDAEHVTYATNDLNQYTQINTDGTAFVPEYDEDGNQTRVRTVTGIWKVQYNAQNRAIRYESEADSTHVITCVYDTQGRRVEKKEEKEGAAISHVRYVYRGYLQVASYDLLAEGLPSLWQIIWDPTQSVATRPLAIRKDGSFLTYGWDLTKNICETYTSDKGFLSERYTYSPFGLVSIEGDTSYQPIQWSSEVYDAELGLVYYNYRYYNPLDGRWTRRDMLGEDAGNNLYAYVYNSSTNTIDYIGLKQFECTVIIVWGHGDHVDQYIKDNYQNYDPTTTAFGPFGCKVAPAPAGYDIPGFPNLQNSNLGDKDRGKENNKKNNAGLNPNEGKTPQDRRQGFANALEQALKSAQQEAEKICENSCCKSVNVIFKGIRDRSGTEGTKKLRRRLKDTNSRYKDLSSFEERKITCPKKKK